MNFDIWVFNNILNNKLQEYIDSKLYNNNYFHKENQLIIYDLGYEKKDNIESLKIVYISKGWKDLYFNKEDELTLQII